MLIEQGHELILHARNTERAKDVKNLLSKAKTVLIADLSDMEATKQLAEEVNALGQFDAIIHNAGVYQASKPLIFTVNVLAPYILTTLIKRPKRLIYIGSSMHSQGSSDMNSLSMEKGVSYSDSKLMILILAKAVARKWSSVYVNTVDPGWVPTKMGGSGAPDDLLEGTKTQVWLASDEDAAFSGRYLFHMKEIPYASQADDESIQEQLIERCQEISDIHFPEN